MTSSNNNISKGNGSIIIGNDFYGSYTESPNGLYTIAWCDADFALENGVEKIKKNGRVLLIGNDCIVFQQELRRPNYGCVANNGASVVFDTGFDFSETKSRFYSFDNDGNVIIDKQFNALPFNASISSDGKYCVCQLCNSDDDDGGTLNMFDLSLREQLFAILPAVGWADSYEYDLVRGVLLLSYKDKGKYAYQFDGNFLDSDKWEINKIESLNGFDLSAMAKGKLDQVNGNITQNTANEILSLSEKALKSDLDTYPNEKAKVYRTMGEVYEMLKDFTNAIKYYEIALNINPKIGLKRKLETLRKN